MKMRTPGRLTTYMLAYFAAFTVNAEPQAIRDPTRPLVPMNQYTPPTDLDSDPNYYYPSEYRVLNCWECFEAQGRICIDEGHNSLYHHTGSSDKGNAFCCKPGSTHKYCTTGNEHKHGDAEEGITSLCSPSSISTTEYASVLTSNRNHQMFAFCPAISH
jgi:hypothetical protein